jgi:hypothetical protein
VDAVVVHHVLRASLDPILRDLRSTNGPVPKLSEFPVLDEVDDFGDLQIAGVWLGGQGGARTGITVMISADEAYRIYRVADQVQEWAIEELWPASSTNWPPCPTHPDSHPLVAEVVGDVAVWMCPADSMPVASIGALI